MSSNPVYLGSKGALEGLGQTARAAGAARTTKTLKIKAIKWLAGSVADPRHFGVDPDPRIHASD